MTTERKTPGLKMTPLMELILKYGGQCHKRGQAKANAIAIEKAKASAKKEWIVYYSYDTSCNMVLKQIESEIKRCSAQKTR